MDPEIARMLNASEANRRDAAAADREAARLSQAAIDEPDAKEAARLRGQAAARREQASKLRGR